MTDPYHPPKFAIDLDDETMRLLEAEKLRRNDGTTWTELIKELVHEHLDGDLGDSIDHAMTPDGCACGNQYCPGA